MTLESQLLKIKQNWLLILLIILIIGGLNFFKIDNLPLSQKSMEAESFRGIVPSYDSFAPEVEERSIAKTSSLSIEIKRDTFDEVDSKIKSLSKDKNALILNENKNTIDSGRSSYIISSYTIKVPTSDYNNLLSEFKKLGKILNFNENSEDITEQKINLQSQLDAERARLANYKKILSEATLSLDKIEVSDRIFNLERTIKYLEEALTSLNEKVSYSTIYLVINEEKSSFSASFITFSSIVSSFISSLNALIKFLIVILPWILVIYVLYKIYKRR